jgi:hypothetical protein
MIEALHSIDLSGWVEGLRANLVAELIGTLFTILVLEELMKRAERRAEHRKRWREEVGRIERELPTWEELDFTFAESLEDLARAWNPLMPSEGKAAAAPFLVERLRDKLRTGGSPLKGGEPPLDVICKAAHTFVSVGSALFALHSMFPNGARFAKHFIDLSNWMSSLRTNIEHVERTRDQLAAAQGEDGTRLQALGKNLYFARGAVVAHAWQVFRIVARISDQIRLELDNPLPQLADFAMAGSPTWLEIAASGPLKLARWAGRRIHQSKSQRENGT